MTPPYCSPKKPALERVLEHGPGASVQAQRASQSERGAALPGRTSHMYKAMIVMERRSSLVLLQGSAVARVRKKDGAQPTPKASQLRRPLLLHMRPFGRGPHELFSRQVIAAFSCGPALPTKVCGRFGGVLRHGRDASNCVMPFWTHLRAVRALHILYKRLSLMLVSVPCLQDHAGSTKRMARLWRHP